jgi:hypothetical protein
MPPANPIMSETNVFVKKAGATGHNRRLSAMALSPLQVSRGLL